mmetsp:Transcript_19587/g.35557  ORF Transcript_19587/g.35557 Transcript_19587/m.35557 type:complete len:847 (-) Transcript_19587:44-2584(-)
MSFAAAADKTSNEEVAEATPCRVELSLNPEDGSLMTAPLSTVLLTATDGLYSDLYKMAHGEIDVAHAKEDTVMASENHTTGLTRKEKMANLSFAQRRHQLAWRLAQHSKALSHVAGLTAASASSPDFALATKVSTKALQHARTAWVQADEAQDALYFFHAQLFPARQAPHDVYGALDVLQRGEWRDLVTDMKLKTDPYQGSQEYLWTSQQVAEQWHLAVQRKLLTGEVGYIKQQTATTRLWNISLKGGIVTLTQGTPKQIGNDGTPKYPIEAHVTVLSTAEHAEWTLLSIQVEARPKTGESSHQLDPTNRQRFDLHRLCVQAMKREEARAKRKQESGDATDAIAQPLNALFQVAHTFHLSWQLEVLSAQAQALKRGVWATTDSTLHVNPVTFLDNGPIVGTVCIAFWSVDDRYGPPRIGDLTDTNSANNDDNAKSPPSQKDDTAVTNKFVLSIRAESDSGMHVSISGGYAIMETAKSDAIVEKTVKKLLAGASDPFALSASDVLLAATTLCGERKCHAVVQALQYSEPSILPKWMRVSVERGGIAVAARVSFGTQTTESPFVVLFRLECDARTGSFVFTFSRSATLLRMLSCNHPSASDAMALRMAKASQHRQKGMAATATGRFVKDSFDGLTRSMNMLGQRTGVGGEWVNANDAATVLRQRSIRVACADVKASLATCCGVASVYGLSALSLGVATGVTATADMSGGPIELDNGSNLLPMPPVAVVLVQRMIQKTSSVDGDTKKRSFLDRDLFAVSCSVTDDAVTLFGFHATVEMESPASVLTRLEMQPAPLKSPVGIKVDNTGDKGQRPTKRLRTEENGRSSHLTSDLMSQVEELAHVFSATLEL